MDVLVTGVERVHERLSEAARFFIRIRQEGIPNF
jgi:hypothetical protein